MKANFPTKKEVISKIKSLRELRGSRESVAAWAMSIIDDETVQITDRTVWEILKSLGGVDILVNDQLYLYTDEDFVEWEAKLN